MVGFEEEGLLKGDGGGEGELLTETVCTMEIDCWAEGVDVEDEIMVVVTERRRIVER